MFKTTQKLITKTQISILICIICLSQTKPALANSEQNLFTDLKMGSEYYVAVNYLKNRGLIQGYSDGTFRPKQEINRAEALKILIGAINYNQFSPVEKPLANLKIDEQQAKTNLQQKDCPFPDLDETEWYFKYICTAYKNQIVSGYPDGMFRPEQTINKVEALKIAILQAGIPLETEYNNFNDINEDDWFWKYAGIANKKTIIVSDRKGNLNPEETINRGDFSLLIYRLIKNMENNSEFGRATFYAGRFEDTKTTSEENSSNNLLTAAHKTLPINTIVRVTNLHNGKQVDVRINDRGPYVEGTIIDLSKTAFSQIASCSTGVIHSEVEILSQTPNENK